MTETEADAGLLFRRTLRVVAVAQLLSGAGLAAGVTVGALLAADLLGSDRFAGVSAALFALGSAGAAFGIGRLSQRAGRRAGLVAGYLTGALGAAGVVVAATTRTPLLLFVSLLVYGSGFATNLQARYAGTDLAPPSRRATAVSVALVAAAAGALAGPNLTAWTGGVAESLGLPRLAGPFLLAGAAFGSAGIAILLFLRPDPLLTARALAAATPASEPAAGTPALPATGGNGVVVGASIMVLTQLAMVAIMTMTPVQMTHAGHSLGDVGIVIGFHIASMYLPSLFTGVLVDRFGRTRTAVASGVTLLAAGLVAAIAPTDSLVLLAVALVLLGLGWNLGLISGTALIVDATAPSTRARVQGSVDVLVALAGATGGALSGVVVATSGYSVLALGTGILSVLLLPVVLWSRRGPASGVAG